MQHKLTSEELPMEGLSTSTGETFAQAFARCPEAGRDAFVDAYLARVAAEGNRAWPLPPPPPLVAPPRISSSLELLRTRSPSAAQVSAGEENKRGKGGEKKPNLGKRQRRSSETILLSVAAADGQEPKKRKCTRRKAEHWDQAHFEERTRLLSSMHLHIEDPDRNSQCLLMEMKQVCPEEFGDLESFLNEPRNAGVKNNFWPSAFSVFQRAGVPYTPFMREGGIVFVLNFPPSDLLDNGMLHSGSPNASKDGFFNSTINTLLKLIFWVSRSKLLCSRCW